MSNGQFLTCCFLIGSLRITEMANPPKIDRKTLRTPDEFVRRGQTTLGFFVNYRNYYLPVIAAAALLIGAYYGYHAWSNRNLDKGWRAYYVASKLPENEKWDRMKMLYQDFRRSRPGVFAAVAIADHYFSDARKEAEKGIEPVSSTLATEWYAKALEFKGLAEGEKQLLSVNRGATLEMQKKWDEALRDYETAANQSGEGKGWALLNVGRIWELKNDLAKAKPAYERVTLEFANSEYAKQAKNHLRRM